jgi:hypothetical protein
MKKICFRIISNTRSSKMNTNNKHTGFAIAVIALIGLPLAGCGNGTTSAVQNTPVAADYTISGLSQVFDNEPKPVTITAKPGKSGGTVTVYYEGTDGTAYPKSAAAPSAIGKYAVTFDVAAAAGWEAAAGLSAGTLEINESDISGFTTVTAFGTWLSAQPANTADTAYTVRLNVDDITNLSTTLYNAADKYVCLDLSGSTFTSIEDHAFLNCTSLTGVTIPDSVTSIGDYAFRGCINLESVIIPDSVTSIGNYAFHNCTILNSLTIGNSVTSIGGSAFIGCTSLTSVTIPDSVTSIEGWAFYECTSLASVTIPNSVTSIGEYAFYGCTSLTSVTIPDSVTSIEDRVFWDCTSLTSVTIPNSVTSIGSWAFATCTSLTSITIPNSVTIIGSNAFGGCTSLPAINVDSGNSAYTAENGILYNKAKITLIQYPAGKTDSIFTMPDSVTSIGEWAFDSCTSLTSVTIPNSVTSIVAGAFYYCYGLTAINVDVANTEYSSVDGVLYSKDQTVLHTYPAGKSAVSFIIPNSVTGIGEGAFSDCISLASVTIPNGVTSIGLWAFDACTSLISVTFEGTISSSEFASKAFGLKDYNGYIGDLREKFYATDADNGTPGTYTRESGSDTWVKG